jgi:hypothetical protein
MGAIRVNDEVIYQMRRWQVVRVVPQVQSIAPGAYRRPDRLRLMHRTTGEAVWADTASVVPTGYQP